MGKFAFLLLLFGIAASAEDRTKRQATNYGGYGQQGGYGGAAGYQGRQQQPQQHYQPQQQQPQQHYQPQAPYSGQPAPQQYGPSPYGGAAGGRPAAGGGGYKPEGKEGEEKDQGPHPLTQLLEKSKFECGPKKDGYYADSDVGCQAFHYCVGGAKHSMMCPGGTVFHQVHLNCVPSDQDICNKADKFFFVNDYLNKPLDQRGPNNTLQYHQRYYPDGYSVGDPFIPPQEVQGQGRPQHAAGGYGQAPAYGQAPPQQHPGAAPYGAPQQRPAYAPQQYGAQPGHAGPPAHAPQAAGHSVNFPPVQTYNQPAQQHQQAPPVYQSQRPAQPPAGAYGAPQHYQAAAPQQYGAGGRSRFGTQY